MVITVGTTKGGVGKTTLAVLLAATAARTGREVLLIDADRQGTASAAISLREDRSPRVPCEHCVTADALQEALARAAKGALVIIDAGGRDSATLRGAVVTSDLLVMPYGPRSYDVWGLEDMAGLIDEARRTGADPVALALLTGADPGGAVLARDNREAYEAATDIDGITAIDPRTAMLTRRKAFSSAAGEGLAIAELHPRSRDTKAERELISVYQYLMEYDR